MNTKLVCGTICVILGIAIILSLADSEQQPSIRVAHFTNIGHAIPIVGIQSGVFDENISVPVETKLFDSGPQVIEAMFANSIDIAYVGPVPAINGFLNSQNGNLKILAGATSGGSSFIVHPDSADDFVFDGKKIAAPQIGSTQDVSLRNYLSKHDLQTIDKGGTVTIYNIPNPDIYTLFVKGDIDAAWVAEPWATILEQELGGVRLFFEEDLWPDGQFASVLLIANSDYISENPQIIRQWMQTHFDIVDFINENPKETVSLYNEFLVDTYGKAFSDIVIETSLSNVIITSDPIAESIDTFAQRADALGYLGRHGYNIDEIFISNVYSESDV